MNDRSTYQRLKRLAVALLVFGIAFRWCSPRGIDASTIDPDYSKTSTIIFEENSMKLVGTAVSGDSSQSIAVIEDLKNGRQWSFHEGDRAGNILIKSIHRNHIVIDAGKNSKTMRLKSFLDQTTTVAQSTPKQSKLSELSASLINRIGSRERFYVIDRTAVESAFTNAETILNQIHVMPARLFNRERGFRITDFDKDSIFSKMGLRSGDLLLSINDNEISGPEEANSIFEAIRDGGNIDLTVRRRARTYHINLLIQ